MWATRSRSGALAAMLALCCSAAMLTAACRKTAQTTAEPPKTVPGGAQGASGMKAYVDPDTGKLTDSPPPGATPLPGDVLTPPTAVEKPAPGGGTKLELHPGTDSEGGDTESDP